MSTACYFHLKQPTGWFAAGREVDRALQLLSDAAFKLFVWLCLHADRSRGTIPTSSGLAAALVKPERQITAALDELVRKGVCAVHPTGEIEITDRFWPYQRTRRGDSNRDLAAFLAEVKRSFLERRCVRSTFTPADEKLASRFYQDAIPLADVQHAILLGALRKYAALINNGGGTPITTLHYFTALISEVRQEISPNYWAYVDHKVRALEKQWSGFNDSVRTKTK
jgi:hypothetical protein